MQNFRVVKEIDRVRVTVEAVTKVPAHSCPHGRPSFYEEGQLIEVGAVLRLSHQGAYTHHYLSGGYIELQKDDEEAHEERVA